MSEGSDDVETARRKQEEQFAKKEFGLLLYRLQNLPPTARAKLQGVFTQHLIDETLAVETPHGPLSFVLLGRSGAPALSLLRRQPDTIAWIDAFQPNSVFWDVGANVGIYSLYAALRRGTRIVAFEPAAINYFPAGRQRRSELSGQPSGLPTCRPRQRESGRAPRGFTVHARTVV